MPELPKQFDVASEEPKWYDFWSSQGWFAPAAGEGEPFCVMIPPPNVTGRLHMGHAFQNTLMDILVRQARMQGRPTLWQVGTDHAGIATQMVVERRLNREGHDRRAMGRDAFVQAIWHWKDESGAMITQQLRRLGVSVDWDTERFTLDEGLSRAVQRVFIDLHAAGLVERGKRLVNWDPVLQTAISDLEIVHEDVQGSLWTISYPVVDHDHVSLHVATTRPETLFGDVAVAVHPEDERYQALIGLKVRIPLCHRVIPIIADPAVEPDFGTGCVKITPAHDFNDYAVGLRHGLPCINILNPNGTLNGEVPSAFQGLSTLEARLQVVEALGEHLCATASHTLKVPKGDRTQAVIEPYLTNQWFVRVKPLAERAIHAVETGQMRFVPEGWTKTFFAWMHHIEDWCVSRQLWWGHRIPAWYAPDGRVWVGESEASVRACHNLPDDLSLKQDEDVLDTWFSSALWPFSTLGWPDETQRLQTFYPTSVLVTGFDIIFFWVARMIMMGLYCTDKVPFQDVYIHGLVRDAYGQKMSKSKGNVLDPIDLIDGIDLPSLVDKRTSDLMQPHMQKEIAERTREAFPHGIAAHGTDALRFAFATLASTGRDINFDVGRLEGCRHFINKIWQATRFVDHTFAHAAPPQLDPWATTGCDLAMMVAFDNLVARQYDELAQYRFDLASQGLYDFFWSDYCDWYLEYAKACLRDEALSEGLKDHTRSVLWHILIGMVKLLHPFVPFVTESIWQHFRARWPDRLPSQSVMVASYPRGAKQPCGASGALHASAVLRACVGALRVLRSQSGVHPHEKVRLYAQGPAEMLSVLWGHHAHVVRVLVGVTGDLVIQDSLPAGANRTVWEGITVGMQSATFDPEAEARRRENRMRKLQNERTLLEAKLQNARFLERAPGDVVDEARQRHAAVVAEIARLSVH